MAFTMASLTLMTFVPSATLLGEFLSLSGLRMGCGDSPEKKRNFKRNKRFLGKSSLPCSPQSLRCRLILSRLALVFWMSRWTSSWSHMMGAWQRAGNPRKGDLRLCRFCSFVLLCESIRVSVGRRRSKPKSAGSGSQNRLKTV